MNTNSIVRVGRSLSSRKSLTIALVVLFLIGISNLIFFLPTAQAKSPAQGGTVVVHDLRGSDPAGWTTTHLTSQQTSGSISASVDSTPTYVYQTIYNGAQFDSGHDEVVDEAGNAYILARAYDDTNDVMIVKLSPSGAVLFVTYLRGSLTDYGTGLTLDGSGVLLVVGFTDSADFPVVNAAQPVKDNNRSGFLVRLSTTDGSVIYSSFFGANRSDEFHDVAVNSAGDIFLVGKTDSTDFPTLNPIQPNLNLTYCFCDDAFILHLAPDAHTVLYSTYLGGEFDDQGDSIGLDSFGNIYVAGITQSDLFPTVNPIQSGRSGGSDVWAARISSDGSTLDYSTYLGGSATEYLARIAVDGAGNATLAGTTNSYNYPTTASAYQPVFGGGLCGSAGFDQRPCYDAFVTRLAPDGSSLVYSTFMGSGNDDEARGVAVDEAGNAYIVGYDYTTDVPPTVYIRVSSLDATGSLLRYTVDVFSAVANDGHGIALGPDGDVYITGAMNAPSDLYAARLTQNGSPAPTPTPNPTPTPQPGGKLHVGDLDGSSSWFNARRWRANVTVEVHGADENPVANVTVKGSWSGGYSGNAQCTTNAEGLCTLTSGKIRRTAGSVSFTVKNLAKSGFEYDSASNHDPDGDSNGTQIIVSRP